MAGSSNQLFSRQHRLTRSLHFHEAFDQDHVAVGRLMVARLRFSEDADLRLGVITSRKVGGAVTRSRARRRLREAWRRQRSLMRPGFDVVLIARRSIQSATAGDVETELLRLMDRLGALITERDQIR